MYYFAYGSNMSRKRLQDRINANNIGNGKLVKHQLRFHKISRDGTGKCNIFLTNCIEDHVLGVIYEIDDKDIEVLDRIEGKGYGYASKVVDIEFNGVIIGATSYVATNIDESLEPFDWYREHVLRGAIENGLDSEYIEMIKSVSYIEDTDSSRKNKELSIYE